MSTRNRTFTGAAALFLLLGASFGYELLPVAAAGGSAPTEIVIAPGQGFRDIAGALAADRLIRSPLAFTMLALLRGSARALKPGVYELSQAMSAPEILETLASGARQAASVVIPEGSSIYDVDHILAGAGVVKPGALLALPDASALEGKLFPDTYQFFLDSSATEVAAEMTTTFEAKAAPLLAKDAAHAEENLVLASLVEKEVPDLVDQRVVAGILKKRLAAGVPLQVDATICYLKKQSDPAGASSCYPLTPLDFARPSSYNTYLHRGLPPGPIGSPGLQAIQAVLDPKGSPYWFYLSDPMTKKTIFSETLDEQEYNRVKYLKVK